MITKMEGFIVSTVDYGDSSKVINILTKEYGMVGIMCKGVKSLKSKLRALTLRFTYGFFYVYYKPDKLSILKDIDIILPFSNIHNDITLISHLNYMTELTYQVFKESNENTIFSLFIVAITKMEQGLDPYVLSNILEIKYLPFLGVGLNLDECIRCGSTKNIITIDPDAGGYLCQNCVRNEKIVSLKTVKMLRMYFYVDISSISSLSISDDVKKDMNFFLNKYYERYTGMYLKSKDFLKKIANL